MKLLAFAHLFSPWQSSSKLGSAHLLKNLLGVHVRFTVFLRYEGV